MCAGCAGQGSNDHGGERVGVPWAVSQERHLGGAELFRGLFRDDTTGVSFPETCLVFLSMHDGLACFLVKTSRAFLRGHLGDAHSYVPSTCEVEQPPWPFQTDTAVPPMLSRVRARCTDVSHSSDETRAWL